MSKVDILDVLYKITAQALTDVIGGQVMMSLPTLAAALPHIRAGRLKALAVTSAARGCSAGNRRDGGVGRAPRLQYRAVAAPAGTPADVIVRVHAELNRALPDAKQRISNLGVDFAAVSREQFTVEIRPDTAKCRQRHEHARHLAR